MAQKFKRASNAYDTADHLMFSWISCYCVSKAMGTTILMSDVCFLLACLSIHVVYEAVWKDFINSQYLHLLREKYLGRHQSPRANIQWKDFLANLYTDGRSHRSESQPRSGVITDFALMH
jgi:hypothetical protein